MSDGADATGGRHPANLACQLHVEKV